MAAPFFIALNLLMIGGTPTFGGHYFVDIIAGGLIAFVAIAASRMLSQQDRSFFNQAAASIAFQKGKLPH
jgi:membrane-associated phospholipid phosphatase